MPDDGGTGNANKTVKRPAAAVHFFAGGLGGMCGSIVTAPFDVVKTRLQSDIFKATRATAPRTGLRGLLWHFVDTGVILRDVYRYEGPRALFKGLGPTLVGVVPGRSINFFVYGNGKRFYADRFNNGKESATVHLSAAATAGVVTATATNPIWVVKTVLQLQQQARPNATPSSSAPASRPLPRPPRLHSSFSHSFRSLSSPPLPLSRPTSLSVIRDIFRTQGVKGFYKGLSASLLGVTEGTIQWTLYEHFKRMASDGEPDAATASGWKVSAAAGGAKLVATMITYPHEVVRTRLRQPVPAGQAPRYTGLVQSFRLILAQEGAKALYSGLSPHLLRVVPNAVTMYYVYEAALKFATPPPAATTMPRRD